MIHTDYTIENSQYQKVLDTVYKGTVIPMERYINPRAAILHLCNNCCEEFYARPFWLIKRENRKHICYARYGDCFGGRLDSKEKPKLTKEQIVEVLKLAKQGKSLSIIARLYNVKPAAIRYQLKKNNLL